MHYLSAGELTHMQELNKKTICMDSLYIYFFGAVAVLFYDVNSVTVGKAEFRLAVITFAQEQSDKCVFSEMVT